MTQRDLRDFHVEDLGFAVVVIGVTLAFFYLLGPYSGAILWAFVGAVLFEPMTHRAALRLGGRRTLAAAISMLVLLAGIVVPAIAIGTGFSAIIARMIRSSMLEVMQADYMRTAASKGLTQRVIMVRHALPNALIPVITVIGIAFALLISGAVVKSPAAPSGSRLR